MFNLLSSVGGIDSIRFQRPQSMKDQRGSQSSPPEMSQAVHANQNSSLEYSNVGGKSSSNTSSGSKLNSKPSASPSGASKTIARGDTNNQLDSLLEGSLFNKRNRYMQHIKVVVLLQSSSRIGPMYARWSTKLYLNRTNFDVLHTGLCEKRARRLQSLCSKRDTRRKVRKCSILHNGVASCSHNFHLDLLTYARANTTVCKGCLPLLCS